MSLRLFQQNCGYVTHKCDLLPGLTVEQTLHYAGHITTASKVLFINTCCFYIVADTVSHTQKPNSAFYSTYYTHLTCLFLI